MALGAQLENKRNGRQVARGGKDRKADLVPDIDDLLCFQTEHLTPLPPLSGWDMAFGLQSDIVIVVCRRHGVFRAPCAGAGKPVRRSGRVVHPLFVPGAPLMRRREWGFAVAGLRRYRRSG